MNGQGAAAQAGASTGGSTNEPDPQGGAPQAGSSTGGFTNEPDPQGGAPQAGSSAGGSTNEPDPMSAAGAPPEDSECGLSNAAFCESFEAGPAATRGRAGDVDPALFSMGRVAPQNMSGGDKVAFVGYATLPTCREGVSGKVVPPDDTLICTPTTAVGSSHLLMAVASQNYGLNSLRVRQPFDFAGRTGTIGFDVDATMTDGLFGWASLEITEDPDPTPLFTDYEYGPLPRNALELQFDHDGCTELEPHVSLKNVLVFADHVLTKLTNLSGDQPTCFATKEGHLNRIRVRVSQTKVEVLAGDFSADGLSFPEPRLVFSANMDLPFSRGYVHFSGHNHATLKYGGDDSWVLRWDNVGFDGPRIMGFREYEIPDSRTPATVDGHDGVNLGYQIDETGMTTCCPTASVPSLTFENVDVTGAGKATLTFTSYYLNWEQADITKYTLRYRFNGREFISRVLTAGEVFALNVNGQIGSLVQSIDVPLAELQNGTNTLEFVTSNVDLTYKPVLANIDLVLQTE